MNQTEKKLYTALGVVLVLTILLSVFSFGVMASEPKSSVVANQINVLNVPAAQSTGKLTQNLGQSLKEQQKKNPATVTNNYKIDIKETHYSGKYATNGYYSSHKYYNKNKYNKHNNHYSKYGSNRYYYPQAYYKPNYYHSYNPYGYQSYNGYYGYKKHMNYAIGKGW